MSNLYCPWLLRSSCSHTLFEFAKRRRHFSPGIFASYLLQQELWHVPSCFHAPQRGIRCRHPQASPSPLQWRLPWDYRWCSLKKICQKIMKKVWFWALSEVCVRPWRSNNISKAGKTRRLPRPDLSMAGKLFYLSIVFVVCSFVAAQGPDCNGYLDPEG